MTPTLEPFNPPIWEDGLYETKLEAQLAASLNQARKEVSLPQDSAFEGVLIHWDYTKPVKKMEKT